MKFSQLKNDNVHVLSKQINGFNNEMMQATSHKVPNKFS